MSTQSVFDEFSKWVAERNPEAAAAMFSDDAFFAVPGPEYIPFNGRRHTQADIVRFFRDLWDNLIDSEIAIDEQVVQGQHLVVFGTVTHTAKPTGRRFPNEFSWHFKIDGDRIVFLQIYDDTYAVAKAFEETD